jgi:6,7-dimethyl-8-ribityllumazine synthase
MSEPYDHTRWDREETPGEPASADVDLEQAQENVFEGWPSSEDVAAFATRPADPAPTEIHPAPESASAFGEAPPAEAAAAEPPGGDEGLPAVGFGEPEPEAVAEADRVLDDAEPSNVALVDPDPVSHEHAPGELEIPPGYGVLEGAPDGTRRAVAVVVSRFNGDVTSRLLDGALEELERAGVTRDAITVMPVPGAFELPIGAMALARTRRFACIVALGCVIRGETPHFDYVAGETASGLQLAALETGVPVAFGVLTLERADQADARLDKGAEAVRTALEMADLFSHLRAAAAR